MIRALHRPVLIVQLSRSWCAQCGEDAFPHELLHVTVPRLTGSHGSGCGVRWRYVSTDYIGPDVAAATKARRPDLEYVAFYDIPALSV